MVKVCAWGTCNSDTRYPERVENVNFVPFPKPKTNFDKCLRWVKACGRPHAQLNPQKVTRHTYVCSKHFLGGNGPTKEYPDPLCADGSGIKKSRTHWKKRQSETTCRSKLDFEVKESQQNEGSAASETDDQTIRPLADHTDQLTSSSLDVLSAVAEMRSLQQQVEQQQQKLNQQAVLIQHLQMQQCENDKTSDKVVDITPFTIASILKQEKKVKGVFKYYTNLKYSTFMLLHQFLTLNCLPIFETKRKDIESLTSDQQLLLTLMRLRHNFGIKDLASRFHISTQAVSEIFLSWIDHMYLLLGAIPIWPHRDDLINSMPQQYKAEFPTTMAIIDCTELKTQKPSSLKLQSQMYSDYKSSTTLKGLVACDPMGNLIFVSELHTGSMSDKDITIKSGFLKLLQQLMESGYMKQGDSVMADKGFTISEDLEKIGIKLNIPPFVSSGSQLSQADVTLTNKIAQHRIHVERTIRRIRTFRFISGCIPTSVFASVNKIWTVCALLTLWQNPVLKKK